jgi:hypothetical protein
MNEKEFVDRFLTDVFYPVDSDLMQMLSQHEGLDFGIIILICSSIELMGALGKGTLNNSYELFQESLKKYFPSIYSKYPERLYYRYRCGLAHQAFIKPGTATARNPNYRELHLRGIKFEGEEDLVLFIHPDVFADDFFKAKNKFIDSFKTDPDKVGRAHQVIEVIYSDSRHTNEPIEPYLSLPDADIGATRQPVYKYLRKSEVR